MAAPLTSKIAPIITPKPMMMPMLPIVPPKPLMMLASTSLGARPATRPAARAPMIIAGNTWILVFVTATMIITIATTRPMTTLATFTSVIFFRSLKNSRKAAIDDRGAFNALDYRA